ncbi:hypothetical protein NECAME_07422 [Necator americanus]|uniref:DOMON domain-containing protein n=1 Tax=Necator americanus TaxID=51031 RepID=W2TQG5_NECAM|nr:hypothetical protein NECAME_07422 [Necator americanus]ETN83361.1 hypothetical protein NECAME_07422 [Necator americanus]
MINWKHTGRALLVEIEADLKVEENGSWLALGISKDDIMATEMLLKDSYAEIHDGRALCGTEWMLDFTVLEPNEKKLIHRISSGKYHLMFAFGGLSADSKKEAHELVGEGAPWRSNDQTRFCSRCPTEILDV